MIGRKIFNDRNNESAKYCNDEDASPLTFQILATESSGYLDESIDYLMDQDRERENSFLRKCLAYLMIYCLCERFPRIIILNNATQLVGLSKIIYLFKTNKKIKLMKR